MTGISDIFRAPPRIAIHASVALFLALLCVLPSPLARLLAPLERFVARVTSKRRCPQPALPDPRPTLALARATMAGACEVDKAGADSLAAERIEDRALRWAVLLPITSRGSDGATCWPALRTMASTLISTIPPTKRALTRVHVAIDMKDVVNDTDEARVRIAALFAGLPVAFHVLPPAFTAKLCWIWEQLALAAVAEAERADLLVLLGDDVVMLDDDWQEDVEASFARVAQQTGLPFGVGCVAIRDVSFESFPMFPVVHRDHLQIFGGRLFLRELTNQHGDPYLFELYRRWGAARFTSRARLVNGRGGSAASRYEKASVAWRDVLLTRGIETIERWLAERHGIDGRRVPCVDIIVPTYRCDEAALEAVCALRGRASLHVLIVVDRPDASNLPAIKALGSHAPDHTVRVYVQPTNMGASMARNTGYAQSFGDHAIFLDDDVFPALDLVDACARPRIPPPPAVRGGARAARARTYGSHAIPFSPSPPPRTDTSARSRGTQRPLCMSA